MLELSKVTSTARFASLEKEWNSLLARSRANTVFLTWEWLFTWWKHHGDGKKLRILLARDDGKLVGIAPLFVSKTRLLPCVTVPSIRFLGSEHVGSDYLDFIIEPGAEREVMRAIIGFLDSASETWGLIDLTDVPEDSENLQYLRDYGSTDGRRLYIEDYTICPFVVLPDSWGAFLDSLSKNMRYNVRRRRRKLSKDYRAEFQVIAEKDELEHAIDELASLNRMRMRAMRKDGAFLSDRFSNFHRDVIRLFFDRGFLRLCFLRVDGSPVSVLYIFKYNEKYFYYQSGLDLAWERFSPGLVLFSHCIENAISEGMSEFDFLQGEEDYKYRWGSQHRKNVEVKIFRNTPMGSILSVADRSRIRAKKLIKGLVGMQQNILNERTGFSRAHGGTSNL